MNKKLSHAEVVDFIIPFAQALHGLKESVDKGKSLTLTPKQANALLKGINLIRQDQQ